MDKLSYSAERACSLTGAAFCQQHRAEETAQSCFVERQPCGRLELVGAWWQRRRQGRIEWEAKGVTKEERSPATSYPEQKVQHTNTIATPGRGERLGVFGLVRWAEYRGLTTRPPLVRVAVLPRRVESRIELSSRERFGQSSRLEPRMMDCRRNWRQLPSRTGQQPRCASWTGGYHGPWAPRRLPPVHLLAAFDSASSALLPRHNLSRDSDGLLLHLSVTLNLARISVSYTGTRRRRSPKQ